ncbi:DUF5136 domain-containing protein [Streptomyces sp. adm13(2018)]|nr:DUF5136 domain-containing protein [Streptomyces sp. adm13(2018)]
MTPTAVPRMNDVTARARWTQKYAVGSPASSKARPLPSFQRFFAKVTQITQDQTPNASRNQETRRLSFMGCPSRWRGRALPVSDGPLTILWQGLRAPAPARVIAVLGSGGVRAVRREVGENRASGGRRGSGAWSSSFCWS